MVPCCGPPQTKSHKKYHRSISMRCLDPTSHLQLKVPQGADMRPHTVKRFGIKVYTKKKLFRKTYASAPWNLPIPNTTENKSMLFMLPWRYIFPLKPPRSNRRMSSCASAAGPPSTKPSRKDTVTFMACPGLDFYLEIVNMLQCVCTLEHPAFRKRKRKLW